MMTVRIAHTPEPEKVVAAAAKLCYPMPISPTCWTGWTRKRPPAS